MKYYFDNAASTMPYQCVVEATHLAMMNFGNPSSVGTAGDRARRVIEESREQCARAINAYADEIYFTSGGTESNNWAIISAVNAMKEVGKKHIITSSIEHKSILNSLKGLEVTYLSAKDGYVDCEELKQAIRKDTGFVSVMMINNEIGTIQPIQEIGAICRERGIIFHTDAVQAFGKIKIDVRRMNIDMMSVSGHKAHAPKGTGFLYCREGVELTPLIYGGGQERGKRSGTENVPGIRGLGVAAGLLPYLINERITARNYLCRRIIEGLAARIPNFELNCNLNNYDAGIINFNVGSIDASGFLLALDAKGVSISNGSACEASTVAPSYVLRAIGCTDDIAENSFRVSLSGDEEVEEVEEFIKIFTDGYMRYKRMEEYINGGN